MIDQKILDCVRSRVIESLKESIKIYTRNGTEEWVNKKNCCDLIIHLQNKTPVKVGGPFWGDHLDDALEREGIRFTDDRRRYNEYWKGIEEGK